MKTHFFLLVILCFFFSQMEPAGGILTSLGRRTEHWQCLKNGGFCLLSNCPSNARLAGSCKPEKPHCCMT